MTASNHPLAIVGIGCLFPKAAGLDAYWANIKAKVDGIGPIPPTHWNPDDYFDANAKRPDMTYARRGGFIDPYPFRPADFGIAPNDLEATDTSQLLALVVAQKALENAGLTPDASLRTSVILGVTGTLELVVPLGARLGHPIWRKALLDSGVSDEIADDVIARIGRGYVGWQENSFPGLLGNVVAGRVANRLDLGGTNCVVDAACASSLSAVHLAAMELQTGKTDIAITGGVDTFNDIFMYMCFSKTPALSPSGDAKPFDVSGDGTILGEGLGIIVLKRLADAERDGNRIYAVIKGIGTSSDGKGNAVYAPTTDGQVRCLRDAHKNAGISAETIELIEAHGTGTRVGDATEASALAEVFREAAPARAAWCALGSVKSQVGHTKAAAGAAGLIKAAMALYHKVLPPTIKVASPLQEVAAGESPLYVNTEVRPWLPRDRHPRRAGVSAFGFGGSNFHCVLEEYDRRKPGVDWDGDVQIVALSADSRDELSTQLNALSADWPTLRAQSSESRKSFNPAAVHRLLLVALRDQPRPFEAAIAWLANSKQPAPDGVFSGRDSPPGRLGFLFPGQGSQSVGMLRDLACAFPLMQEVLSEADRAFDAGLVSPSESRLSDYIYPHPAFTADARAKQETALRATEVAQPALGAVSLGVMHVLAQFGIKPDAAAGHSYGELTALCAAGCFDAPSLFELSQLRGRLMATSQSVDDDGGAMLAVQAPLESVESLLADDHFDLVIANKNGPSQAVLSGRTVEIERAAALLKSRRVTNVRLPVAAAFHSPLVANASGPFRAALEPIAFHTAQLPVFSNSTGREYPRDPQSARDLLAQQLAKPVEFVEQIRNMARSGVRTFVEVGPGKTLSRLVESILAEQDRDVIAIDASSGNRSGMVDLAHALARLAALGYPVRLADWDPTPPPAPDSRPGLVIPICGANYRKARPDEEPRPARTSKPKAIMPSQPEPNSTRLEQALRVTQESLAAFQRLQEQTAQLHKQFLETQESAQRTLQTLVEGQQRIVATSLGLPTPTPPLPEIPRPAATVRAEVVVESPPPVSLPADDSARIQKTLIDIVAEKTGYPPDMLDPDMGLDSDLGIDSIKRVEILSALQDKLPDAPMVKPEHLGTLRTLREIVAFLNGGIPAITQKESTVSTPEVPDNDERVLQLLIDIVAEKTGYPTEMLGPDMGLDADLGIDSIKRVEILSALQDKLPEAPVVKPEHLGTLHTLREIASFLCNTTPAASISESVRLEPAAATEAMRVESQGAPLDRRVVRLVELPAVNRPARRLAAGAQIWVVGESSTRLNDICEELRQLDCKPVTLQWTGRPSIAPADLAGLILVAPAVCDRIPRLALQWLQSAGPALRKANGVLASLTQLDGSFGLSPGGPQGDPAAGALAGLAKTAALEWPEVNCKALDCAVDSPAADIIDEIWRERPVEVGLSSLGRYTLEAISAPILSAAGTFFGPSDVIVITGGARGVTAEVAIEVARTGATVALFGRSPAPSSHPDELAHCPDAVSLKRALAARGGLTPKQLDAEARTILADREIRNTLERIAKTGGRTLYRSIDVRDAESVGAAIAEIRRSAGLVTAIIHGAGVLADHRIEELTAERFDGVYDTKVVGMQNLLAATAGDELKAIVAFSSSTARFGRIGQAAYAAANEALNKIAQREARQRPACRVVALNWGPWAGGMVTPGLEKLFTSEGIGLIPLVDGARHLSAEMAAADRAAEVVVLGPTPAPKQSEFPAELGLVFERELALDRAPVLRAHVIDGRAVLPMALTLEWLAHAALHAHPGLSFHGCERLRVFQPVTIREKQTIAIRLFAGKAEVRGGMHRVAVELRGENAKGREVTYSHADVILSGHSPAIPSRQLHLKLPAYPLDPDDVYQRILFHGPELRGIEQIIGCGPDGIVVTAQTAPAPPAWLDQPLRGQWLADPLILDCAFQAMSVWCHSQRGAVSLPSALGAYRQYRRFPTGPLTIGCRISRARGQIVAAEIEFLDSAETVVARIEEFECVLDPSLNQAFRRNRLESAGV